MSSTVDAGGSGHPISVVVARIEADLDGLIDQPTWSLNGAECRKTLVALTRTAARLAELELRVAHQADASKAGEETGATTTANWWAHATRQTRTDAHRKVRLANALDAHEAARAAMARGEVLPDQAYVIIDEVDALPAMHEQAEKHLLAEAEHHDARELRRLGRHVLEVLDPAAGEAHQARLLEQEEARAAASARFTMTEDGHGRVHGRFTLPLAQGAMLKKALLAITAPKHQASVHGHVPERRPSAERMGQALCEYVERYQTDRLPSSGGVNATVVVTMTLETLLGGLASASLDTGGEITASQARRLACEAGIIPAVLGTDSVVLDMGRRTRFHTRSQRIALGVEQRHCTHPGCDWPPAMCHAHHDIPWSRGGPTDLKHGRLLCPRHHALAHRPTPMRT